MKKVFVGLSGGVDSSLSAALLVEQGYDVTGVYMKNWSKDLPGFPCPWKEDYQDAKRVAVKLGIKFELFDFEKEYFEKVVEYMLDGFKSGITPNPDIMCNQEIKFKLFYDVARSKGADFIATGHYAQTEDGNLLKAVDENKDQTYFLYRISRDALEHTIFPIGHLTKPQVRKEAEKRKLITANKKVDTTKTRIVWWPAAVIVPFAVSTFWLGKRYMLRSMKKRIERGEHPFADF